MNFPVALCLLFAATSHALRMKIAIKPSTLSQMASYDLFATKSSVAACKDLKEVKDVTSLPKPFPPLKQKCGTYEFVHGKVWQSATVKKVLGVDTLKYTVPGLNGKTVGDVFKALGDAGCNIYPWGGVVRDQFLGKPPRDIDAEVSCGLGLAYYVCKTNFGEDNCEWEDGDYVLNIRPRSSVSGTFGVAGLDFADWDGVFFKPQRLEYTTNAIGYDSNGNDAILDVTDTGVMDTCNRIIRIPGPATMKSWDAWGDNVKQYRYFKLIYKGYKPSSEKLRRYNAFRTKEAMRSDPGYWAKWYCKTVLDAKYDKSTKKCKLAKTDKATCSALAKKQAGYDRAFKADIGLDFWNTHAVPGIKEFMVPCGVSASSMFGEEESIVDELEI